MGTETFLADSRSGKPPVALIAGPTASGKSDLAVKLALTLHQRGQQAVVINADSAQVYADLAVLSARPAKTDVLEVPHMLFGEWDGAQACSAADWADTARQVIAEVHAAEAVPILVGGTGLYLRTLLDGIAPVPPIEPEIRTEVRAMPVAQAHAELALADPLRAARLAPNDSARVARALEVVRSTGKPLAYWQTRHEGGIGDQITLHPLILLPDRDWLYARCDRRFSLMIQHGAVQEVEALLARGLNPDLPVMRAIGVPELAGYLRGEWSLAEAEANAQQATRNYAKRQFTWFRRQPPSEWARTESINVALEDHFASLLRD
ncbi:MAG: tRNA (adenosine(37)-N6)-dimethylallyltransferase MiaA [Novosphingobium sp.]|jgi:tRNA dimethylallyltransferase